MSDEILEKPKFDLLTVAQQNFLTAYKRAKTISGACLISKVDRYTLEYWRCKIPNFTVCMDYVDKEIADELEYILLARAGVFGEEEFKKYKSGSSAELISILKVRNKQYKELNKYTKAKEPEDGSKAKRQIMVNMPGGTSVVPTPGKADTPPPK